MSENEHSVGLAVETADRDELVEVVADQLRQKYEEEPTVDDDGDFVLHCIGQPVWVRVQQHQPVIEIFTRVAHEVYSRRAAAIEVGILNRDNIWSRWALRDRDVYQSVFIPAHPFAPAHLGEMLDLFFAAMRDTRDDLALRLRAKVA